MSLHNFEFLFLIWKNCVGFGFSWVGTLLRGFLACCVGCFQSGRVSLSLSDSLSLSSRPFFSLFVTLKMRNMIGQIIKMAIPIYPKIIFIIFDSAFSKRSRISYEFGSNFPPKFAFFWLGLGFRGAGFTNHPFAGLTSGTTDLGTDIISGAMLLPNCGRWREVGVRILWRAGRTEGLIFPGLGVWKPCVKPEYSSVMRRI